MKNKVILYLMLIVSVATIDFGLVTVFMDAAFRSNNPTIQYLAFILVFVFPLILVFSFFKGFIKYIIAISLLVSFLCISYLISVYGFKMLTDNDMILFSLGFIFVVTTLIRLYFFETKLNKNDC